MYREFTMGHSDPVYELRIDANLFDAIKGQREGKSKTYVWDRIHIMYLYVPFVHAHV